MALIILVQVAYAGFGACGSTEAPNAYYSSSCSNLCSYNSGTDTLTCDIDALCAAVGGSLTIIGRYGTSSYEYSAWAVCDDLGGTTACCAFEEGGGDDVDVIHALGTPYVDGIYFTYPTSSPTEELKPTANHDLIAVADGLASGDSLQGSDHNQNDYQEYLHGNDGGDYIYGNQGGDRIWGGRGHDYIQGDGGPDRINGGEGDDHLYGEGGDDILCDITGYAPSCATDDGNLLDGGEDDDTIWYEKTLGCYGTMHPTFSVASPLTTEALDYDACGNMNDWSEDPDVDWPDDCDEPTAIKPNFCDTAWPY